jgi:hypothetical protein|nr:MAG TPA: Tape measure domain protein [Bacteriophage sp.]
MAVEIPVVIDIDKAFDDAIKKLPSAMRPLKNTIEQLSQELNIARQIMAEAPIDSKDWQDAANMVKGLSQSLEVASDKMRGLVANDGSIKQMTATLASLNRRWEEMGYMQKFQNASQLSSEAEALYAEYKRITKSLQQNKTLTQLWAEEQAKAAKAAERQAAATKAAQDKAFMMSSPANTLGGLQKQESLLRTAIGKAVIGSNEYNRYQKQLEAVRGAMARAQGQAEALNGTMTRQQGILSRLASQMGAFVSIFTLVRFVKQVRDVTGELEYQRVALSHLIQDEEYGARLFEQIKKAAIESPFRIKELVTYTKSLAAYNIAQQDLFDTMMRLSDISAGLGVSMDRLVLAYGQVRAASVLRGTELRQFTEAGIPLVDLLAEKFTELNGRVVKSAEVFDLISKRAVPFKMISEIFEDMTDKGGMFYKMQEQQAETLRGRWEKLKDAFDIGLESIGKTTSFGWQNDAILSLLTSLANNLRVIPKLVNAAAFAWVAYNAAQLIFVKTAKQSLTLQQQRNIAQALASKQVSAVTAKIYGQVAAESALTKAITAQYTATNFLTRAWNKLRVAMLTNPIGVIAAAISAAIGLFMTFRKKTEDVANSFEEFDKVIEDTSNGLKDFAKTGKLIDRYERLADITKKTDKEHRRLFQTMTLLQDKFPEVGIGVDNETVSLEEQLKTLQKLNAEKEKQVRERGKTELENQRINLSNLEKNYATKAKDRLTTRRLLANKEALLEKEGIDKYSNPAWRRYTQEISKADAALVELQQKIDGTQKRIVTLDALLHPENADNTLAAWRQKIKELTTITINDVTSNLYDDEQLNKWESLDDALSDIIKNKDKAKTSEEKLSESIRNQTGDIRDQIEAQLDWARAVRQANQAVEDFFGYYSRLSQDVSKNFPGLLGSTFEDVDKETFSKKGLFSESDLKSIKTVVDLYSLWATKIKAVTEEIKHYNDKVGAGVGAQQQADRKATIKSLEDQKKLLEEMGKLYGFVLDSGKKSDGYQQDPWILIYKNRMKFMEDFRKSVEDLDKYMNRSSSLSTTQGAMTGRGKSLNIDVSTMSGSREELLKWYDDTIDEITKKIKNLGGKTWAGMGVQAILAKDTKSRTIKAWQDLLAEVFKARTDFDLSQQKKDFEKAFNKMKEELKNTEAARNFYKDILGQTGDEQLAQTLTISVYGDIGKDFKERIQSQLDEAFKSLSKADQTPEMKAAIDTQDFGYILSNLDKFSQEWQKVLQEAASSSIQYNAKWLKDLVSSYEKHKTFEERITETKQREAQQRVEIQKWEAEQIAAIDKDATKTTEEKTAAKAKVKATSTQMQAASTSKEAKEVSNIEMEALKATYEWTKAFEDMDNVSTTTLKNLIALLTSYIDKWKDSGDAPESLKAAVQALEQAQAQITERNPYQGAIKGIKDYIKAKQTANRLEKEGKKGTQEYKEAQDAMRKAMKSTEKSVNDVGNTFNTFSSIVSSVSDILNLDEMSDGEAVLQGIAAGLTMVGTALVFINAMFTLLETNPIVLAISAIIASVAALGMIMSNLSTAKANREIENQQVIVDNLEKSYKRLEKAMEDSFGSDYIYNYNEQMKNLQAQADAYQKMADAERSKGRKADDDKIKEYEESMDDILEKMDDMKHQLSEYFSGTDLTSAAEDFAKSWIDAYREFSSTTSAMKEKFKEMIDNMIIKSVAGQIMQKILKPVFDAIETYSEDGELSVEDIAKIADMTTAVTDDINASFTALMERFTAAGMNIRATGSSLSGISKDIAGASEESINALASGINTQNFYMSYMPNIDRNVAAILVAIQGGSTPNTVATPQTTSVQFGDETFRGQMSRIDENVAGIYQMMRSVITPKSANINTHCVGTKS